LANNDYVNAIMPHLLGLVGVFISRSPNRPNQIAFCVVDLIREEGKCLVMRGVDALEDNPLLDIKPYAPALDLYPPGR
jgi:tRNA (Thr-GGU) A37 N-methylase